MELGSAIARQLENQAFNTGSENGNVVFKYNHGSGPPFYSATADRRAVGCTWTMWKTSGHDAFFLMVNFITQTATLTVDSSTLTPEFQHAFAGYAQGSQHSEPLYFAYLLNACKKTNIPVEHHS